MGEFAQMFALGRQAKERRRIGKEREELQGLGSKFMLGQDPNALGQIAAISPQRAAQFQQLQAQQQKQQQENLQKGSMLAQTVLDADPEERPQVYRSVMAVAKNYGLDLEGLPEMYSPEADAYLNQVVGVAKQFRDPKERKIATDVGGRQRFVDTGKLAFPEAKESKEDRKIIKDSTGKQRFVDTGKLVFEGIKGTQKKMSGSDAKTLSIASGGLEDIITMRSLIKDVGGKITAGTVSGGVPFFGGVIGKLSKPKEKQLRSVRSNLADRIGRIRSGGAINKDEEKRFMGLLPGFADDPETIEFKLEKLEKEFSEVESKITGKSSKQPTQYKIQRTNAEVLKSPTPEEKEKARRMLEQKRGVR